MNYSLYTEFYRSSYFEKNKQNKTVNSKRDAWLTLFSYDKPEDMLQLIMQYPEFQDIYKEAYGICRNIERVMEMFSEELYELDRNTVQYMIDEMQDTIDAQKVKLEEQKKKLEEQEAEILQMKALLLARTYGEICRGND